MLITLQKGRRKTADEASRCDRPRDPQEKPPQQTSLTLIIWEVTQHERSNFFQLSKWQLRLCRTDGLRQTEVIQMCLTNITVKRSTISVSVLAPFHRHFPQPDSKLPKLGILMLTANKQHFLHSQNPAYRKLQYQNISFNFMS